MSSGFGSGLWGNFGFGYPVVTVNPNAVFAGDLAYVAYRIAGVVAEPGRGYSTSEGRDAIFVLNSMLKSLQAERLMVYGYVRSVFDMVLGQQDYLVGDVSGFDWGPILRPEEITLAGYIFTKALPAVENQMRILTYQEWAALSTKELRSNAQYEMYYEATVPNGTVHVWPIPTDVSVKIALYTWENIQTVDSLQAAIVLPPAYQELLEYGLAIRLAGMFPRRSRLDPNAVAMYDAARLKVMAANVPHLKMQAELSSGGTRGANGTWNMISNSYVNR